MIPQGTVYIQDNSAGPIAKKLGLDFVKVMVSLIRFFVKFDYLIILVDGI